MQVLTKADVRFLRRLAKRHRVLMLAAAAGRDAGMDDRRVDLTYQVVDRRGDCDAESVVLAAAIQPSVVQAAVQRGWLEADASDGCDCWRLSERGLRLLRETISDPSEPASASQLTPLPAADRLAHAVTGAGHGSALAWLRQRRDARGEPLLSEAEFEAGERLRADFERAMTLPHVTANLSPDSVGGASQSQRETDFADKLDRRISARQRLMCALDAVAPELRDVVVAVCCEARAMARVEAEQGWPARSGRIVLTLALRALARHYGLSNSRADDVTGTLKRSLRSPRPPNS